jgi:hypothetical protein
VAKGKGQRAKGEENCEFYDFRAETLIGGKWLCVVVKYEAADAFVVTAYLMNKPRAGEDLWPKS